MHVPGETNPLPPDRRDAADRGKSQPPNRPKALIHPHVYDLRRGNHNSDGFFDQASTFSNEILPVIEARAGALLDGYSRHAQEFLCETPRSRGEYAIDFLTLGMALRRYEGAAQSTSRWVVEFARELVLKRSQSQHFKPTLDWLRGGIARYFLAPGVKRKAKKHGGAVERLARLIDWLNATGEFDQEAMRLNNWRGYMAQLKPDKATWWLRIAGDVFDQFETKAAASLGSYTRGVESYLRHEHPQRRWREDMFLCAKPAVEYHLNILAAEVMNRGMREDFEHTAKKIVLVPTCMRGKKNRNCMAHVDGVDITCAACDPDCAVNRVTRRMRALGATVYMVPHASGFSRWLRHWQSSGAGVAAVACLLNILPGGYEMRKLGIASQCVPLDFPGCRKHWDSVGIPTALNEERLVQLVAMPPRMTANPDDRQPG
jgi:hypothetical protein